MSLCTKDIEDITAKVPMFCPMNIRNLKHNEKKLWCTCGLSKTAPWCDGRHKGTKFKPIKWIAKSEIDGRHQLVYHICNCKYTSKPPYCDGRHALLPVPYFERQEKCTFPHDDTTKLCPGCGWAREDNDEVPPYHGSDLSSSEESESSDEDPDEGTSAGIAAMTLSTEEEGEGLRPTPTTGATGWLARLRAKQDAQAASRP